MAARPVISLPKLSLPEGIDREQIEPIQIVDKWLSSLEQSFKDKSSAGIAELFIDECWWRDVTALSWDITTKKGQTSIAQYIHSTSEVQEFRASTEDGLRPALTEMGPMAWIQSGFSFKTQFGFARGFVRLANVGSTQWNAWTVLTQLEKLKDQDELDESRAREPVASTRYTNIKQSDDEDLQVLIIGAGQCGLALGAELKNKGIKTLIVDKASQIASSWRNRYDTVTAHTPIYGDHFPFLRYPTNWPVWVGRQKLVSWMDHYAEIMELDVQLNTLVKSIEYVQANRHYRVETESGEVFTPRHLVCATGIFSGIPIRPDFQNESSFKGRIYHSVEHKSAAQTPDLGSKRIAVVGTGTTSHDIAQDFVNSGAKEVTMIQRSPGFVISLDVVENIMMGDHKKLATADADLIHKSFPFPIFRTLGLGLTQMMAAHDAKLHAGLEKAGMAIKKGDDGISLIDFAFEKFGRFYNDQGASEMIIDGRIKIQRCEEGIREFDSQGIVLANGNTVEADVVVLATGTQFGSAVVEQIVGKNFFDQLGDLGGEDKEGERIGWWRPTTKAGFWYMPGNFLWSRQFSRVLALQIAAVEKGFNKNYYASYEV